MSFTHIFEKGYCGLTLNTLQAVTKLDPTKLRTVVGTLSALKSQKNMASVDRDFRDKILNRRDGMIRLNRIKYRSRYDNSVYGAPPRCDFGNENFMKEVLISASSPVTNTESITEDQMRRFCDAYLVKIDLQNPSGGQLSLLNEVYDIFDRLFEPMRRKINNLAISQLGISVGANIGGGGIYDWWNSTAGGQPVMNGIAFTLRDLKKMYITNPILVGGGTLDLFMDARKVMCCNDGGVNAGMMANGAYDYYRDYAMDDVLGLNNFVAWEAGAMQLATANYKSTNFTAVQAGDLIAEGMIQDPLIPGLFYDVEVRLDTCTGNMKTYNIWAQVHVDLFAQPIDGFDVGDPLYGTNLSGIFEATEI